MHKAVVQIRILFTGVGIVLLVAVLLTVVVIPSVIMDKSPGATPDRATIGIAVVIILHLLLLYAFRKAIIVNKQGGHLINAIYIVSGIGLSLLGLIIMDGATAYLGHNQMQLASISMFICVGCDFLAAVIAIVAMFLQPRKEKLK